MTGREVFASLSAVALIAALTLAVLGWLTAMPDGSRRFRRRTWAWVCTQAMILLSFTSIDHPRWWNWGCIIAGSFFCLNRIEHWWRFTERARVIESAMPWKRGIR